MSGPVIGAALALGGMALGYAGSMGQAEAQRRAGRFNKDVASRNAHMLELAADEAKFQNTLDIIDFRASYGSFEKTTEAAIMASGFDAYSGTGLEILLSNAEKAEEDIRSLRRAGEVSRQNMREQAVAANLQGVLAQFEGETMARATSVAATASLLSQAGDFVSGGGFDAFSSPGKKTG